VAEGQLFPATPVKMIAIGKDRGLLSPSSQHDNLLIMVNISIFFLFFPDVLSDQFVRSFPPKIFSTSLVLAMRDKRSACFNLVHSSCPVTFNGKKDFNASQG
jgi:hypothetical protein